MGKFDLKVNGYGFLGKGTSCPHGINYQLPQINYSTT